MGIAYSKQAQAGCLLWLGQGMTFKHRSQNVAL